jgi:hypothetical protein
MSNFKFPCFNCEADTDCVYINYKADIEKGTKKIKQVPQTSIMCLECGQTFDSGKTMDHNLNKVKDYKMEEEKTESVVKGAFMESLTRNNRKIREDRALTISEDSQMLYKRKVEDLETKCKRLHRERESMLDLSPGTTQSLEFPTFNPDEFVDKDIEIGKQIRETEIILEIAKSRYNYLFGGN